MTGTGDDVTKRAGLRRRVTQDCTRQGRARRRTPRLLLLLLLMLALLAGWPREASGMPPRHIRSAASPALALNPTSGAYPQTIALTGAGFGASETVNVYIDSTGTAALTSATTSVSGAFATSFSVPNAVSGTHPIIAVGQGSGLSATTGLLVTPKTYLAASTVIPGTQDTLTGHGFAAHETIVAYWQSAQGQLLGTTATYSKGDFTGAQSLTFTVPLSPAGSYSVVTVGLSSGAIYTRTLTVATASTPGPTASANPATTTPTAPAGSPTAIATATLTPAPTATPSPSTTATPSPSTTATPSPSTTATPAATAVTGTASPTPSSGAPTPTPLPTLAGDWPMYLHDPEHTDADLDETILSPATIPQLTTLWTFKAGNAAAGAPTVVNGVVYIGSWDGYEYAFDAASGALKWKTFLGLTFNSKQGCASTTGQGITSAATVQNGMVYVGGGDSYWYALDAVSGAVLWRLDTGDNSANGGHYNWSSPLIYNGYAYIGVSSLCDAPLVTGQLLRVSLATHQVINTFDVVPLGQSGGSIWSSPAIDPATNTLYVTTGNDGAVPPTFPLSESMIALDANTLALKGSWQLPPAQVTDDADFGGSSPVLFSDATNRPLVAAINKNGYLYAFDRGNIGAGPLWERQVAVGGASPDSGDGSVSTGAFANGTLYMAAYNTTINGLPAQGSVRAFDPATGNILWEHSVPGVIFSALAYANGLIIAGGSGYLEVLDAASGALLYSARLGASPYNATVYSLSVAQGRIYVGLHDGTIDTFGLPRPAATPTATPPPDPSCPPGWACQDVGAPALSGAEVAAGGVYTVTAGGSGIHGTADQFRFLAQTVSGDSQISAQVITQTSPSSWTKAGLMLRQSMDPAAAFYAVFLTPGHGLVVQSRIASGSSVGTLATNMGSATPPLYVQIQRRNDNFVAATSSDGVSYTLVPGSQITLALPTNLLAGLAVSAQTGTRRATAVFGGVALGSPAVAPATPTPPADAACPAGWNCADIGSFTPSGSEAISGTTWTVRGAGQDLGGYYQPTTDGAAYDELRFVWQPLSGDGAVSARVISQTNTASAARAGVMLRGSTDPGAPYYAVYLTPQGIRVLYRLAQGGFIRSAASMTGTAPLYLEAQRSGTTFTALTSADGVTWQPISGTSVSISMGSTALAGLAVSSTAAGVLGMARFDSITLTGTPGIAPSATDGVWHSGRY